jgi:prepilin-type N-terminal cleavage/methylation domain-containing protein
MLQRAQLRLRSPARRSIFADPGCVPTTSSGFTLVELLVALALLTVGLIGAAGTATILSYYAAAVNRTEQAARLATSRIAALTAGECVAASGVATDRGVAVSWRVRVVNQSARAEVAAEYEERGRRRTIELVTGFLC